MLVYKWIENVFIVEGHNRDCIYDPHRREYHFVPSKFKQFVSQVEGSTMKNLIFDEIEKEWLDFLIEGEFVFDVPKKHYPNFTKINTQWIHPSDITNSIICHPFITESELKLLDELLCKHIVVILPSIYELQEFLKINFKSFGFQSIDIYFQHGNKNKIVELIKDCDIIANIYSNDDFKLDSGISLIINFDTFTESQVHNTYFNRKFYIGMEGEIKNAPECDEVFGYINDISTPEELKQIINSPDFQYYWFANKEVTDVCKDCEFRHMCVDSRLPVNRKDTTWYHTQECNYNPYICKWQDEEGYLSLSECGVISNEKGFSIDHERIAEINEAIWGQE